MVKPFRKRERQIVDASDGDDEQVSGSGKLQRLVAKYRMFQFGEAPFVPMNIHVGSPFREKAVEQFSRAIDHNAVVISDDNLKRRRDFRAALGDKLGRVCIHNCVSIQERADAASWRVLFCESCVGFCSRRHSLGNAPVWQLLQEKSSLIASMWKKGWPFGLSFSRSAP